jgi:hypothetical protein
VTGRSRSKRRNNSKFFSKSRDIRINFLLADGKINRKGSRVRLNFYLRSVKNLSVWYTAKISRSCATFLMWHNPGRSLGHVIKQSRKPPDDFWRSQGVRQSLTTNQQFFRCRSLLDLLPRVNSVDGTNKQSLRVSTQVTWSIRREGLRVRVRVV